MRITRLDVDESANDAASSKEYGRNPLTRFRLVAISMLGVLGLAACSARPAPEGAAEESITCGPGCAAPIVTTAQASAWVQPFNCPNAGHGGKVYAGGAGVFLSDGRTNDIYRWSGSGTLWTRVGPAAQVFAVGASNLYRIAADGREDVYTGAGEAWNRIGFGIAGTMTAGAGTVFTNDPNTHQVYKYLGTPGSWTMLGSDASRKFAANATTLYRIASDGLEDQYVPATASWTRIGFGVAGDMIAGADRVWTTDPNSGQIYRYNLGAGNWTMIGPRAREWAANDQGLYVIDPNNHVLFYGTGSSSVEVGFGSSGDIAAGGGNLVSTDPNNGDVYLYGGTANSWTRITCHLPTDTEPTCSGDPPAATGSYAACTGAACDAQRAAASRDVLTQHNDNARSGVQSSETALTPTSVANSLHLIAAIPLPAAKDVPMSESVYAQPLYVAQAAIQGSGGALVNHDIVIAATLGNHVYAFDAAAPSSTSTPLWSTFLGCPQQAYSKNADGAETAGCIPNFNRPNAPNVGVGIVSTPVIDAQRSLLYVVSRNRVADMFGARHFLHALDLRTGAVIASVEITTDTLCGSDHFNSSLEVNRAGLSLTGGKVYVSFGSAVEQNANVRYHGWIFEYDVSSATTLTQTANYCTTPRRLGGGIWQSGNGLAIDDADPSHVYFETGNAVYASLGAIDSDAVDHESSFVRLHIPGLTTEASFDANIVRNTKDDHGPINWVDFNGSWSPQTLFWNQGASDADLGSSGPVLLPGSRLLGGGKLGIFYQLDRATLNPTAFGPFRAFSDRGKNPNDDAGTTGPLQDLNFQGLTFFTGPHIHGSPVYWDSDDTYGSIFAWSERDHVRRFRFDRTANTIYPSDIEGDVAGATDDASAMPGGFLTVSSNGRSAASGVIWAVHQNGNVNIGNSAGYLYAFNAQTLARVFPAGAANTAANAIPSYAKFTAPTVGGGHVFLATTMNQLLVYGL